MSSPETNGSHVDLVAVRAKLQSMAEDGRIDELIALVIDLLLRVKEENNALTQRLQKALRALYGRKSEKVSDEELKTMLAQIGKDAPAPAPPPVPPPPPPPLAEPKPLKSHKGRNPLPSNLPRRKKVISVPPELRTCAKCGTEKKCIDHVKSEILDFIPAQFIVIEECREKLACPACESEFVVAPSEKVMDKGRPGSGLLAKIVVDKCEDSMPLYRQCKEFARLGVPLSTSTIGDWSAFALDVLAPIARRIKEKVIDSGYINADDTGLPVLDNDHPNGVKRGHLWAYAGGGLVAFHYTADWKAEGPMEFLRDFRGHLQGDGYAGYEKALRDVMQNEESVVPEERRLGCGMHIRRKFEEAAKLGDVRAAVAINYFKAIYKFEKGYKEQGLSADDRLEQRKGVSLPLVDELYQWIRDIEPQAIPKTPLYAAIRYAKNQEDAWRRCFSDGKFEIDNGEAERRLRWVAIGRKNFLFAGSDTGAERLGVGYTLTGSCHANGVNPLEYLTDAIEKLQSGWPMSRLDELLPNVWRPGLT
ncbi:MAG TPA: IS66 family transposase [Polyangium sp.]|nr:IS66 family transposase [Polyangium sp.]